MNESPLELSEKAQELSRFIAEKSEIVAGYEIAYRQSQTELKRAQGKAAFRLKGSATPSVIKMCIENDSGVIEASDKEQAAFALMTMGKAELDGLTAQFQAAKECLKLRIQEMQTFRA